MKPVITVFERIGLIFLIGAIAILTAHAQNASAIKIAAAAAPKSTSAESGIHKIRHVIIIMQENRSFDHYFGTFPGADGFPMKDGVPTICIPDPITNQCVHPFVDHLDLNGGGPHSASAAALAIDGGKMDGFISLAVKAANKKCRFVNDPTCGEGAGQSETRVMGYHVESDIPNYWVYAKEFVLQDHMFEPIASWSLPSHLYMVSAWSAKCSDPNKPESCQSDLDRPWPETDDDTPYAWTDLTWLLNRGHVSWAYYLDGGPMQTKKTGGKGNKRYPADRYTVQRGVPPIWNVLPQFTDVHEDKQLDYVKPLNDLFAALNAGTLPAVSWIAPSNYDSEHPPSLVSVGQSYVTHIVNAVMQSSEWDSTAIFISWDDWGGYYDHLRPPVVDKLGYGIRVPGIVISPYAKRGYIDHQPLSFDAYLKFIEDDFLNGARLDPKTDGRPDPRPDVREDAPILGDLTSDFDFSQKPRPPLILPEHPTTTLEK